MIDNVLISVIIPVYNMAQWLPRCLDSVLAQTYKNLEIIVIDDGSSDNSPGIVDLYAKQNKTIKAIHQNNQGLIATRERGIREATGEFIGFIDGDDEIVPEMYEKLLMNAFTYDAQISQCGILCIHVDGRREYLHGTREITVYDRLEGCAALLQGEKLEPSLCNKIYHASLLKNSCLDSSVINNEDMLRNIVLFNRASRSVMEDFCGYVYWRRNGSMSNHKNSVDIVQNILKARKIIVDYVPDEIKKYAIDNYLQGAARCYNSLLSDNSDKAVELKNNCRDILKKYVAKSDNKFDIDHIRIYMIIYTPLLYNIIEKKYLKMKHQRRRKRI